MDCGAARETISALLDAEHEGIPLADLEEHRPVSLLSVTRAGWLGSRRGTVSRRTKEQLVMHEIGGEDRSGSRLAENLSSGHDREVLA